MKKINARLDIFIENFLDTLQRRLSFKFQVHSISKKELQCSKLLVVVQATFTPSAVVWMRFLHDLLAYRLSDYQVGSAIH